MIDLIGFRRHGHNEGDEPTYTQPLMYRAIEAHPGVKTLYAQRLVREGVVTEEEVAAMEARQVAAYERALEAAKTAAKRPHGTSAAAAPSDSDSDPNRRVVELETGVSRDTLVRIGRKLSTVPAGFRPEPEDGAAARPPREDGRGRGPARLGHRRGARLRIAAFWSGTPIRISGQDSSRGTFSQRHAVLVDTATGETWTPLATLDPEQSPFEACDSPLSEFAVLGFEYGYSVEWPEALVLWEAQFGDFANGAQVIVDQFIASAEDKWRQTTRMVMLLPHGSEGQGPEHSSARIERYLQLCADGNLQICNTTTPAQYFHVLRRQMRQPLARPLILFTPKSLLRLPAASSSLEQLTAGGFRACLDDSEIADRARVTRVLFCCGKVYYDLRAEREKRKDEHDRDRARRAALSVPGTAARVHPARAIRASRGRPGSRRSPGTWAGGASCGSCAAEFLPQRLTLDYVGRAASPSPATGNAAVHKRELEQFLAEAFA